MHEDPEGNSDEASTGWLHALRLGDSVAAQKLWDVYFTRLTVVAQVRLGQIDRDVDGEDVALSALKSVMIGLREGRYPKLDDESELWPLLVTLAARKSIDQLRRQNAQRRDAKRNQPITEAEVVFGTEPSPEFSVEVADELERLVTGLDDPRLRTIAYRRLEGYSTEEIAAELSLSKRSVLRKLGLVRRRWEGSSG